MKCPCCVGLSLLLSLAAVAAADERVIEDFESDSYRQWTVEGDAFGSQPALGAHRGQMDVSGYRGQRLINSFAGGDQSTGTATSPEFQIEQPHIAFLIGGGSDQKQVGIELLIDGQRVRVATGSESEELLWSSWNVKELQGKTARLRVYDRATGGWGHINVDHIIQTDQPPTRFDLDHRLSIYRDSADYLNEPLRPQYHFTPEINWMNDPNGLVYHDGEYHLFYQYNPAGNSWGHMSWGHAVSRDLVHWKHLPLAIPEEDGIMAFSGSCVVDKRNATGFGRDGTSPMVAIYTGHGRGKQTQNLAYSNDNGRTWTKYDHNPVLDIGETDFRDPKVFWHEPTQRWIMVVALAVKKVIVFYESADLKQWNELSRFGPAGVREKANWECPDLFELPVENEAGKKLWVLEADMGSGSIAGGSGGEYFVGHFDDRRFTTIQQSQWVDFGRDFYAPVSWSNVPESDGRRIWIGWMNNWQTALIPTSPWRSCMSVPRSLSLRKVAFNHEEPATYVLVQRPVKELESLRMRTTELSTSQATWPPVAITQPGTLKDMVLEIETEFVPGDARSLGFRIRTGEDEFTEIGYDRQTLAVYVDRRRSGVADFHAAFAGRHESPVRLIDGKIKLRILIDRSTVEVFINDGETVITDRIFPTGRQPVIEAFVGDESAKIGTTLLHEYKSVWKGRSVDGRNVRLRFQLGRPGSVAYNPVHGSSPVSECIQKHVDDNVNTRDGLLVGDWNPFVPGRIPVSR